MLLNEMNLIVRIIMGKVDSFKVIKPWNEPRLYLNVEGTGISVLDGIVIMIVPFICIKTINKRLHLLLFQKNRW